MMSQTTNNTLLLSRLLLILLSIILLTKTSSATSINTTLNDSLQPLNSRQLQTIPSSVIPTLKSLETITTSSKSTSGFLFNIRATRSPLILYGLGLNFVNSIYIKSTPPPPSPPSTSDTTAADTTTAGTTTGGNELGSEFNTKGNFGYNEGRYAKGRRFRIIVYTKTGTYEGYENDIDSWNVWLNTTVVSGGIDTFTNVPQRFAPIISEDDCVNCDNDDVTIDGDGDGGGGSEKERTVPIQSDYGTDGKLLTPLEKEWMGLDNGSNVVRVPKLIVPLKERQAFYVSVEGGPYLRYNDAPINKWYYQNDDLSIYSSGSAKRMGWDGATLSPRLFSGAVHYYTSDKVLDLGDGVELLPEGIVSDEPTPSPSKEPSSSPMISPTSSPTISMAPTISMKPTNKPTAQPTNLPTLRPTSRPTSSPIAFDTFTTEFLDAQTKPVLVYAGAMFDIKARSDIEISSLAFNTWSVETLDMSLYIKNDGTYKGIEDDLSKWTWWANVTVQGMGLGNPTILEQRSFEPIIVKKQTKLGIYLTTSTNGAIMRLSKGEVEGRPFEANNDLVIYEGVGKRYPIDSGTIRPRMFNGHVGYVPINIPTPSPTIETSDLWVANTTFAPLQDTYIQRGKTDIVGKKAQLMVRSKPDRVALMKFDIRPLLIGTDNAPDQILSVKLRLYSMTQSDYGGLVSIIPGGNINEKTATWDTVPYGSENVGTPLASFRSVWPYKWYEVDITEAFREEGKIPGVFLLRISSDQENGAIYRARDGGSPNGPQLIVNFAYEPSSNKALAKLYGSNAPSQSPTVRPEWADAVVPRSPDRRYFNYNPRDSRYGPREWDNIWPDGELARLRRLRLDINRNRCMNGSRQSPQNLCETDAKCEEFHQPRPRRGQYGLAKLNETIARPTPKIMHNKLRLEYKERMSEMQMPVPPGVDFARNGFNSGIQDLVHMDIKVPSEHTLCNKRYDGEFQQYYLHRDGNLEVMALLIEADAEEDNMHVQELLDFFQQKFNQDLFMCNKKQRRARALFESRSGNSGTSSSSSSKLRGGGGSTVREKEDFDFENDIDDASTSPSFGNIIYQTIHDRYLKLIGRQTKEMSYWDPLQPGPGMWQSVHFWSYSGSLTEPPCSEGVNWRIVDVPVHISLKQLWQMKKLMFEHVDPDTCQMTSSHFEESNARPIQPYRGGAQYRCRRSDYASDVERMASGRVKGFVLEKKWWGVDNLEYVVPEFPDV